MAKLTLTDLANLQNENTVVSAINANNAATESAMENTLSRNGTNPNYMDSNLDMNSFPIYNLRSPILGTEPVTLDYLNNIMVGPLPTFSPGVPTNVLFYETFAAAQAATIPGATNWIILEGYYNRGDGGGARYNRVTVLPYQLTSADGAHWRLIEDIIDIRMFGARCDGATDDTTAINTADVFASYNSIVRPVRFPSTFIRVEGTLQPSVNSHWYGSGSPQATTIYVTNTTSTVFDITQSCTIENFRVLPSVTRTSNSVVFNVHHAGGMCRIRNVDILNPGISFNVNTPSAINLFENIGISAPVSSGVGYDFSESFVTTISNCTEFGNTAVPAFANVICRHVSGQLQIINSNLCSCQHGLFVIPGPGQAVTLLKTILTYFDTTGADALFISPTSNGVTGGTVQRCVFSEGWFAGLVGSSGLHLDGSGIGCTVDEIDFLHNDFIFSNGGTCFSAASVRNLVLTGNNFINQGGGNGMTIANCTGCAISANKIIGPTAVGVFLTGTTTKTCLHDNIHQGTGAFLSDASSGTNYIHDNAV